MLVAEKLPPVESLLAMSGRWQRHYDNNYSLRTGYPDSTIYIVPRETLVDFEETLPDLLEAHFLRFNSVYRPQLEDSRTLLANGTMDLPDEDGVLHRFLSIDTFEKAFNNPKMLHVLGLAIKVETVTLGDTVYELVMESVMRTIGVYQSDLDTQYPGWKARWEIGCDLGIKPEELMHHVLNKDIASSTKDQAINGLTFD